MIVTSVCVCRAVRSRVFVSNQIRKLYIKPKNNNNTMSLILTKAALALKNAENNFQFVKYEAHKPKKKEEVSTNVYKTPRPEVQKQSKRDKDPVLKKIRLEVVKFGMSGFDATKKEEAKIALAISLGAKPPRKPYVNYKELMQKRKEQRKKEAEDKLLMAAKSVMQTTGKKKRKDKNNVGNVLESYGKVQKKDLKKKEEKGPKKKKKSLKISG